MNREKIERLDYKIFTRVGRKKYDELLSLLRNSDSRTISALLRYILEHEKIIIYTHDNTLDKTMEELSGIRKELQAIGININQVTRKLHQADLNEEQLILAEKILNDFQNTGDKINVLFAIIDNLSEKWLPK
jgi:hypothetical protein